MSKGKKIIIAVISIVVVVSVVFVILKSVKKNSANNKTVNVYSVSEIGNDYYYDFGSSLGGSVSINMEQKIYPLSSQKIKEIYVSEGDTVKAGDVIIEYDTTAQALKLETERTEVELAKTAILVAERELEELKQVTPIEDMPQPTTEEPTTEAPTTEAPAQPIGTPTDATPTDAGVQEQPVNQQPEEQNNNPADNQNVEPDIDGVNGELGDGEILYTREELDKAISDKQAEIKSLNIEYQLKEIEYEIMQYQVTNGQVLANFDGVVKTVIDEEEAFANNQAMIVIGGNSGYTVRSSIGELSLDKVSIGETVELFCYDTGMSYMGTITDISMIPTEESYSYSEVLQTNYPMTITIEDAEDLEQGMYMEITLPNNEEEPSNSYYLSMAFVKRDNDNYYVMKEVDGELKKVYVEGGKIIWGETLEIKRGISFNDYIAFPYASDAVEGTKTKHASADELYY
ncbi:MAG: biotin/lipoyl-binding protein [Lachnospiraceae bacterium]|nr:biotin/lipoyl-binding protein [Lachnospiraceae bacterium]